MKKLLIPLLIFFLWFPNVSHAALTDNIVAYWKLDESSGNAADSVGTNTLTNNGTITYASAVINNGAFLGASNSTKYFSSASNSGVSYDAFTISLWVKIATEPGTNLSYLLTSIRTTGGGTHPIDWNLWYQDVSGTKKLFFDRSKPGVADQGPTYNTTLGTTSWHYLVMTYDGTNISGYLDGSLVAGPSAASGVGTSGANAIRIGGYAGDNISSSDYDEMGMWTRALTSTEVTTLYNGGAGLQYPFTIPAHSSFGDLIFFQ